MGSGRCLLKGPCPGVDFRSNRLAHSEARVPGQLLRGHQRLTGGMRVVGMRVGGRAFSQVEVLVIYIHCSSVEPSSLPPSVRTQCRHSWNNRGRSA